MSEELENKECEENDSNNKIMFVIFTGPIALLLSLTCVVLILFPLFYLFNISSFVKNILFYLALVFSFSLNSWYVSTRLWSFRPMRVIIVYYLLFALILTFESIVFRHSQFGLYVAPLGWVVAPGFLAIY